MEKVILLIVLVLGIALADSSTKKSAVPVTISSGGSSLTLEGTVSGTVQLTFYDMKGRRLYRGREVISAGVQQLDLPTGIAKNQVVIVELSDGRWKTNQQVVFQ